MRHLVVRMALLAILVLATCGCQATAVTDGAKAPGPTNTERALDLERSGVAFLAEGKNAQAQSAFEQAIAVDPGCGPAHNNLGKIYLGQQRFYQAAWEFESARKLLPTRPEPENNLGMVFERTGKIDLAVDHYTKAHGLAPDQCEILGNLVRARIRRGDRDATLKDLLSQLVLRESRPDWLAWAKEKLATLVGMQADPSPRDTLPQPEPERMFLPPDWEQKP